MTFHVWYCRRCRMALKVEPAQGRPRACRCTVPILPAGPTVVHVGGEGLQVVKPEGTP